MFFLFRVLTLWFDYGHWPEVNEALVEGIKTIQIDTWLQVIHAYLLQKYTFKNGGNLDINKCDKLIVVNVRSFCHGKNVMLTKY